MLLKLAGMINPKRIFYINFTIPSFVLPNASSIRKSGVTTPFFLILFFCSLTLHGQPGGLELEKTTHNFGAVENWANPVAKFHFTNTGENAIRFLPTQPPKKVKLTLPPHSIRPGQSGVIRVQFYTKRKGRFRQKIQFSHTGSSEPVTLTVKGEILSFSPHAKMQCPRFRNNTSSRQRGRQKSLYSQRVKVIDRKTKQALPQAQVTFVKRRKEKARKTTDRQGKTSAQIPPGRYTLRANAPNYKPNALKKYLKRHAAPVTIALTPKEKNSSPTSPPPTTSSPDTPSTPPSTPSISDSQRIVQLPDTVGGKLNPKKYVPNNIVFLLDVSISMDEPYRLPLLKKSMKRLVPLLRPVDRVAIVKYSGVPYVDLRSVSADQQDTIHKVIDSLSVIGVTYGLDGLEKAYEIAEKNYIKKGNNQIIIATDGLFTDSNPKDKDLYKMVENKAEDKEIYLSVVGFGEEGGQRGKKAIKLMKELAQEGQGNYIHVYPGNTDKAKDALIEEIKIQSIKPPARPPRQKEKQSILDPFR